VDWDQERVARWLKQAEGVEGQLAPVSDVLFAAASLQPGETVLDVGCGTGPTTRDAAVAVGPGGLVRGLDISGDMLRAAASVPVPDGAGPIEWVEADPVTWTPTPADVDVVLSRFGVMFFSDPLAAFTSLAVATRHGGRLAMATWTKRSESELFEVALQAALRVLDIDPADVPREDEGPSSLHDPAAIAALLGQAGWSHVQSAVHRLPLRFAGGVDPATAARASMDFSATRVVTADLDDATTDQVAAAIAEAYADHLDEHGHVVLEGVVVITTASRVVA
jgi:SAM-dependent methyltransferase